VPFLGVFCRCGVAIPPHSINIAGPIKKKSLKNVWIQSREVLSDESPRDKRCHTASGPIHNFKSAEKFQFVVFWERRKKISFVWNCIMEGGENNNGREKGKWHS